LEVAFVVLLEAPPAGWFPQDGNVYMHYAFVIVPGVSALLAYALLRGNLAARLAFLNAAMALALVVNAVRLFITDPSGYSNLGFFAMLVGSLCVVATACFVVLHLAGKAALPRLLQRGTTRTLGGTRIGARNDSNRPDPLDNRRPAVVRAYGLRIQA
jgi:hypothetical protein